MSSANRRLHRGLPPMEVYVWWSWSVFGMVHCRTKLNSMGESKQLVGWCFEPGQPQRITSGLNTNLILSPSYSCHKSSYYISCFFLSLSIFRGYSTREPASSRVTYFILRAYTVTGVSHSQRRKKSGEVLGKNAGEWTGKVEISKEEIPGSKRRCMAL